MILLFLSGPSRTLSIDSPNSSNVIDVFFRLAAKIAASLTKLAKSAPLNPGVSFATTSRFTLLSIGLPWE